MTRMRSDSRRGVALLVAILTTGLVLMFVVIMAQLAVLELARERSAALGSWAEQVIASAQEWSRVHGAEVQAERSCGLPLDDVLPANIRGAVELRRADSAEGDIVLIECRIRLAWARQRLERQVCWPLGTPGRAVPTR